MNDDKLEKISALMDGELDGRDREIAIENIEIDLETRRSWQRYHLIGDTLRNTLPSTVNPDLAAKLNTMLENEPAILAPRSSNRFLKKEFLKPVAGLAIAASVTAVAVLGLHGSDRKVPGSSATEVAQTSNVPENAPMANSSMAKIVPSTVRTVKYEPIENTIEAQRLNQYILNHNQVNARFGIQGVSPNARLVGHEAVR